MHILKRRDPNKRSSGKGKTSLLRRVFSSEKKVSQSSLNLKNLNDVDHDADADGSRGSIDMSSKPKLSQTLSSTSLPGLAQADSFESIWTTRSDSSEEATPIHQDKNPAKEEVVYSDVVVECSPSFEEELSLVLQETIEKLPELDEHVTNVNNVELQEEEEEEVRLEVDCSDDDDSVEDDEEEGLPTPPSSTIAIFSGGFCDFSLASDDSVEPSVSESSTTSPTKTVEKPRSQDIFRTKVEGIPPSPTPHTSPSHCWEKIDDELLQVRFTPSFEGIEMTQSFQQQLETIQEEEPSWYTPSMMDGSVIVRKNTSAVMLQEWKMTTVRYTATVMMLFLLVVVGAYYDSRLLPLLVDKQGGMMMIPPLTELIITPALEELLVQHATDGPVVKKTFYNSHHTAMGAWLK